MGAWGPGVFENDAASDFIVDIQYQGAELIDKTIRMAIALPNVIHLESDEASMTLAAIEYVAASLGKAKPGLPEYILEWIKENNYVADDDILTISLKAINRILLNSELRDLWFEEGDQFAKEWLDSVNDLKDRIEQLF